MKRRRSILIAVLVIAVVSIIWISQLHKSRLILTGIVTTDSVIVSPQIQGRLEKLLVNQGDVVKQGALLAVIDPLEQKADLAFFENTEKGLSAQVDESAAELKLQQAATESQIKQADATVASVQAQTAEAEADLENARLNFERERDLHEKGADSTQAFDQARATYDAAQAHSNSLHKQIAAAEAALDLAKASLTQVAMREAALDATRQQLAAASAQSAKAKVHLNYTELRAPVDGVIDIRAALQGEVVNAGQPIVTLVNPDDLWVRADVEESYIDRVHLGDKMTVRLPSGAERTGAVFFRGVDADYATQRDVSRTKRDIKTFEIRLRCDNQDRSLALGMTAYVTLPLK
ncbi:MAG TPA: efflux RND transporter periplasmic adaptor subunit [Opitutaceae bacterium]